MGEFSPPLFLSPLLSFLFLIPQILIGSNTLLQKFTPHFKILDPRLVLLTSVDPWSIVHVEFVSPLAPILGFVIHVMTQWQHDVVLVQLTSSSYSFLLLVEFSEGSRVKMNRTPRESLITLSHSFSWSPTDLFTLELFVADYVLPINSIDAVPAFNKRDVMQACFKDI